MKKDPRHIDPDLPPDCGEILASVVHGEEWLVPDDYFEGLSAVISVNRLRDGSEHLNIPEGYLESGAEHILAQIHLANTGNGISVFQVPPNYFESKAEQIPAIIRSEKKGRVLPIHRRGQAFTWMYSLAAAASVAAILYFAWPEKTVIRPLASFDQMLKASDLNEEDLEYFASEDDLYNLYLDEMETALGDTLKDPPLKNEVGGKGISHSSKKPLDKSPPGKGAKAPVKAKSEPTFDELTDDEILDYLLHEGDASTDDL